MVQLRPPLFRGPPRIKPPGNHPTMKIVKCQMNKPSNKPYQKPKRRKQKLTRQITGCKGIGIKLSVRMNIPAPNPYSFSCSLRCRHPLHLHKGRYSSGGESDRQDDWISEEVYRRYTETDSRPQSPDVSTTIISRKSASVTRSKSIEHRKCSTPEPETKQCVFHQRRVLVLDLRRVKSVDAITRQSSFTPATSFDDSTAADDEPDDNASSINPESSNLLSPRNLSVSRSVTPKNLKAVRRRRLKDRSNSPLEYERPTSPKILEGAIKEKIKEFEEQEAIKRRAFMRGKYRDGFVSTDSWSTDKDTTEIISAKIVPKVKIEESFDSINFDVKPNDIERWLTPDPEFDAGEEVLQDLSKKYPLIVFSSGRTVAQQEIDQADEPKDSSRSKPSVIEVVHPFMVVSGMKLRQEPRDRSNQPEIHYPTNRKKSSTKSNSKLNRRKSPKKKSAKVSDVGPINSLVRNSQKATRNEPEQNYRQKRKPQTSTAANDAKSSSSKSPNLASATLGELTEELYKRYYSNTDLQLTLPPLHSSVLTLLGQRPNSKLPSGSLPPGSLELNAEGFDEEASGIRIKQKLRRHGRKDKYDREDFDEDDLEGSAEGTRAPSPIPSLSASQDGGGAGSRRRSKILDDPHDTQVSVMSQRDDVDDLPKDDDRSSLGVGSLMDLRGRQFNSYILDNAKSLHAILDEELVGTEWNLGDMNHLDYKISQMKDELNEYETRFKAGHINMKEDLWLALPRTWSRSSATFGVPTDIRLLSKLHPLEYIEKYIFISEPRKLLYSLIFHRYRTMENPTGKTITYSCVPKALGEVLGRQVSENEKLRLEIDLLKIDASNQEITENLFRGICAVTERVFGDYCLEDCNECFTCLRHPKKDKRRCHKNTRNQLEKVDLNYVATKIKEGKVNPLLSELLQTIFERHHS